MTDWQPGDPLYHHGVDPIHLFEVIDDHPWCAMDGCPEQDVNLTLKGRARLWRQLTRVRLRGTP